MRKAVVFMTLSLDGFFEGPDHDISWHNVDEEFTRFVIEQMRKVDLILFGRRSYELMESFWPGVEDNPDETTGDHEIARLMNHSKKIVYSTTLEKVHERKNWEHVSLLRSVDPAEVKRWKEEPGGEIWVGGSSLATAFVDARLIDEFRFVINPAVLGNGTRIFSGLGRKLDLTLVDSRTFTSGNVQLTYRPG
ncbi:MAG TPA: dihydrofolate reductase family protein [Candidatus Eremiobacteraceae bacterium]